MWSFHNQRATYITISVCLSLLQMIFRNSYGLILLLTKSPLKMIFIFLCPPKSLEYFWHFIFKEDEIDAMSGISTCGLGLLAALWFSPYTWWGTCDGEGKWVLFPWVYGEDAIWAPAGKSSSSLHSCLLLVQSFWHPLATPKETHQWQPLPSGFPNLSFYLVYLSLYRPKGLFLKQIQVLYSFFSSDQGIKKLGGVCLAFFGIFSHC